MLHFGGDVANELDLLDFIDDEDERTQIKINYVLQHVVPMLKFSECTDPETSSSSSPFKSTSSRIQCMKKYDLKECKSLCTENNVAVLSEQNLLRHVLTDRKSVV